MVTADIERATGGLADAFEEHNITGVVLGGGLATLGYVAAATAGSVIVQAIPGDQLAGIGRAEVALLGIAIAAVAYTGTLYLPNYLAGPIALGATVAIGSALWGVLLGVPDDYAGSEQAVPSGVNPASGVASTTLSGLLPSGGGSVTNMLPSRNTGCTSCNQPPAQATERGEARSVSHAPARQEGQFR